MSIHRHISHNGRIREASEACLNPGQLGLLSGWGVFSTLLVVDGSLFAWERHWARLSRDAMLLNVALPEDPRLVEQNMRDLIEANGAPNCTLRLAIVRNSGGFWAGDAAGPSSDTIGLTSDSKQWPDNVRLGVQANARFSASDFAGAKILSWAHNLRWAEQAQEQGFDEVILLNECDNVAECTSANLFAVYDDQVFTPPLSDGCLPGVTRELLLDDIRVPGIQVLERQLTLAKLADADEVFISSTTRGLLHVAEIAGRSLRRDSTHTPSVRERLLQAYQAFLEKDISNRKHAPAAY